MSLDGVAVNQLDWCKNLADTLKVRFLSMDAYKEKLLQAGFKLWDGAKYHCVVCGAILEGRCRTFCKVGECSHYWLHHFMWSEIRKAIFKRDHYACKDCGKESVPKHQEGLLWTDPYIWFDQDGNPTTRADITHHTRYEPNPHYAGQLDAHHIIPLEIGGTNSYSNLITLCYPCHKARHSKDSELSSQRKEIKAGQQATKGTRLDVFGGMA
jgi:5-methylcytosine-specific restriction endonuclease McrA